ncbi:MAG TPA: hypothetical protein VH087_17820 [Thermoanaerobaculia bacterium]|jgi:hypothetical protein|nr:hypothetical protein [Thermoanaerobaculia bacterium]
MTTGTRDSIRKIFLFAHPHASETDAATLLGCPVHQLRSEIAEGLILATSTADGVRIPKSELMAAALTRWSQSEIEAALGNDGGLVLPKAIQLTELRARVPRYQCDMLAYLARRDGTTVDDVLLRELEGIASAHSEELTTTIPGFAAALNWPDLN